MAAVPTPGLLSPCFILPALGTRMMLGVKGQSSSDRQGVEEEGEWGRFGVFRGGGSRPLPAQDLLKGKGHPRPKATNASLGSDLKHRPAAGPSPRAPRRRRRSRISAFPTARGALAAPSPTESCPGTAATLRGKGMRIHPPRPGLSRGQAALPAQSPPRWHPREIANLDRGHPARGGRDCSVTAPGTEPDPPLRTPTPAGHRGQLPSAFWEGKTPTFQSFFTLCAAGIS